LSSNTWPDELWEQFGPGAVGVGWALALLVSVSIAVGTDEELATRAGADDGFLHR